MAVTQAFHAALRSGDRVENLRRVAERELRAGTPREQLLAQLEQLRSDLSSIGRDHDEDAVLELMDFITGWCSPHARL